MRTRPSPTDDDSTGPLPTFGDHIGPSGARDSAGRRADQDSPPAPGADVPAYSWSDLRPEIGARGATVTMFMSSLMGDMAAQYLNAVRLTGFGFTFGCVAAVSLARRRALLVVITTPPLILLVAITCTEMLAAHADHVGLPTRRIFARALLTLASTAPWLFGGFAGALLIAACRLLALRIADHNRGRTATPNQEPPHAARQATRKLGRGATLLANTYWAKILKDKGAN